MTEQQFEKLKTLLHSNAAQNSQELDGKILAAANSNIEARSQKQIQRNKSYLLENRLFKWLVDLLQSRLIQSSVLSMTLTLVLFFSLAQILKTDQTIINKNETLALNDREPKVLSDNTVTTSEKESELSNEERIAALRTTLPKPEMVSPRDQILAQMSLPDIQVLLKEMNFNEQTDEQLAQSLISVALNDIQLMLEKGRLDNARQRYTELKESCDVCTALPDTLDALALEHVKRSNNS